MNTWKTISISLFSLAWFSATLAAPQTAQYNNIYTNPRHVLMIGFDGCRADAFLKAYHEIKSAHLDPSFTAMIDQGAADYNIYAGGHAYDNTKQITKTEPGWTTILTGDWGLKTHITKNSDLENGHYNHAIPTLFNDIRDNIANSDVDEISDWQGGKTLASFFHRGNDNANYIVFDPHKGYEELTPSIMYPVDHKVAEQVAKRITTANPTFIYLHFDNPDASGHRFIFSPKVKRYVDAIKHDDTQVDLIMKSIHASRAKGNHWLVILTTDHGGFFHNHGAQHWSDKETFAILNDPLDPRYRGGKMIQAEQGETTFTPTVLNYLHIPYHTSMALDGDVINSAPKTVLFIRYNALLNEVEDGFPHPVSTHDMPGLAPYANQVSTLFYGFTPSHPEDKKQFIFLKNGTYLTFDIHQQKMRNKPTPIAADWPGLENVSTQIKTGFYGHPALKPLQPKYYFLLNDNRVIRYDIKTQHRDKGPIPIEKEWPTLAPYAKKIVAITYAHATDDALAERYDIFLNDGTYLTYDINRHKLIGSARSIADHWHGLLPFATEIKAIGYSHPANTSLRHEYTILTKAMPYH